LAEQIVKACGEEAKIVQQELAAEKSAAAKALVAAEAEARATAAAQAAATADGVLVEGTAVPAGLTPDAATEMKPEDEVVAAVPATEPAGDAAAPSA
jgi:hypothetical protein